MIGLLLAGAGILALGLWAGNRDSTAAVAGPLQLELLAPRASELIRGDSVDVVFRTTAPLSLTPRGWMAGRLHLHAYVDDTEYMPAAADIRTLDEGRFLWRLPVSPGDRLIRLAWSGADHRPLRPGMSPAVRIRVAPAADL